MTDILIHYFAIILMARGALELESIEYAANFVSDMTYQNQVQIMKSITIH